MGSQQNTHLRIPLCFMTKRLTQWKSWHNKFIWKYKATVQIHRLCTFIGRPTGTQRISWRYDFDIMACHRVNCLFEKCIATLKINKRKWKECFEWNIIIPIVSLFFNLIWFSRKETKMNLSSWFFGIMIYNKCLRLLLFK